jgi:hypothetical protein
MAGIHMTGGSLMGVGLYLNGRYTSRSRAKDAARAWLQSVEKWLEGVLGNEAFWDNVLIRCRQGVTHDDRPALFVNFHPAGEEVEVIVPKPGRVLLMTKTSTVGPGYHTALCDLADKFGKRFKIQWAGEGDGADDSQDETGYFFRRDRAAVEDEMLLHLRTMAIISVDALAESGHTLHQWNMPLSPRFRVPKGEVLTPIGPRSMKWIRAVAKDPRAGIDLYPWWDDGIGATFYRGRALARMWTDLRWHPARTGEEIDANEDVHDDLARAFDADPTIDLPWREWAELIDILNAGEGAYWPGKDRTAAVRKRAAKVPPRTPLVGYRRHPVRVDLAGPWSIEVPGGMAEEWEDGSWSAWDGVRTVWVTAWNINTGQKKPTAVRTLAEMELPDGEVIHHKADGLVGKAIWKPYEENGEQLWNLKAFSAVPGKAALCNVYVPKASDRAWALATWKSLTAR